MQGSMTLMTVRNSSSVFSVISAVNRRMTIHAPIEQRRRAFDPPRFRRQLEDDAVDVIDERPRETGDIREANGTST